MTIDPRLRFALQGLAAVVFLIDATVRVARRRKLLREGVTTVGVVVRHDTDSEGFTPVVRFVTQAGEARELSPDTTRATEDWSVGRPVPVIYLPDAPARARIHAAGHLWSDAWASIGVGLGLALLAVVLLAFELP